MKSIPDRWLDYKPYGTVIENTKILAFKVPLRPTINNNVPPGQQCTTSLLMETFPKLKFVIDLTNTMKYYDKTEFTSKDVGYLKIMVPGKKVPPQSCVLKFFKAMDDFLSTAKDDEIIGVHCTHGLNRTGYLICRYLVQQLGWELDDAVKAFQDARGHPIERQEYVQSLKSVPRGKKIDTSAVILKNDTSPIARKSQPKNRSKVIENWRDHPPVVPGHSFNFPPNGQRWRGVPWGCPPPSSSQVDHRPHCFQDQSILQPDMSVPPPGFQIPGPNMYRNPPPMAPPAIHRFPHPRFSINTPRPVLTGPRPNLNEQSRQQSFGDASINGSDNFHTRNNFGTSTGGPIRFRDDDFKRDSYDNNFCYSNGRREDRRRVSRFSK